MRLKITKNLCVKKWILAIVVFLVELSIGVWPLAWIRDEYTSWHSGEGSYILEGPYEEFDVCQLFSPKYSGTLKSIGIVVDRLENENTEGKLILLVSDEKKTILAQRTLDLDELEEGVYQDIEIKIKVKAGKKYYLSLTLDNAVEGRGPALRVIPQNVGMAENRELIFGEKIVDTQLLTRYIFENVVTPSKAAKWIFLSLGTALLIIIPIPSNKWFRMVMGVVALIGFPIAVGSRLELLTINQSYLLPFAMKWNWIIMYGLELILVLILGSVKWGGVLAYTILILLYSVNYYVYAFRGAPFRYNDLSAIATAADVVSEYNLKPNSHLTFAWCLAFLFVIMAYRFGNSSKNWKTRLSGMLVGVVMLLLGTHILIESDFLINRGFRNLHGFDQLMTYHFDGYLVASCIDIQNCRITEPDGYSPEKANQILAKYEEQIFENNVEQPEILILIMNESFADMRVLGNLKLSEENLKFTSEFKKPIEKSILRRIFRNRNTK